MRPEFINVAFLLLALIGFGCTPELQDTNPPDSGEEAPNSLITWDDCGGAIGDHGCDFTLMDQDGEDWNLYSHYDTVMVVDFSTMWCGPCQSAASEVQAAQDAYEDQGFLWITVLIENVTGEDPSLQDIQSWANTYGIDSAPVLAGGRDMGLIDTTAENGYPISSWPTLVILDRDLVIRHGLRGWSHSTIIGWIEEVLEE